MHTIIIRDKAYAASILERLRRFDARLSRDGGRYVITYRRGAA